MRRSGLRRGSCRESWPASTMPPSRARPPATRGPWPSWCATCGWSWGGCLACSPRRSRPTRTSSPRPAYYRADQRFSAATNADRIQSAQRGAAALAGAAARARDFGVARRQAELALRDAAPGRVVRTRHGDPMLLTEFLRTRVLELAVHGLDLAAALDREPWMTIEAARVTEDLLLPCGAAGGCGRKPAGTGWA